MKNLVVRSVLTKTGMGLWGGLLANLAMPALAVGSLFGVPPGTPIHADMEALGIVFYGIVIAVFGLSLSIYDLVKRRWWGIAGVVLSLTPAPLCLALLYALMRARGIYSD